MTYQSSKLTELEDALNTFDICSNIYKDALDKFNNNVTTLYNAQTNLDTASQKIVVDSTSNSKYLCTKEGYVFRIDLEYVRESGDTASVDFVFDDDTFTGIQNYDKITILGKDYVFINDISAASIINKNTYQFHTNTILQKSLKEFGYNKSKIKSRNLYANSDISFDSSFVTITDTCDLDSYHQCANYARTQFGNVLSITNDPYRNFGLGMVDNSCVCFVAKDSELTANSTINPVLDDNFANVSNNISYGIHNTSGNHVFMNKLKDNGTNYLSHNINNISYIQANNKLKFLNQNEVLKDNSIFTDISSEIRLSYESYNNIGINKNLPFVGSLQSNSDEVSAQTDCNTDASCIGYVEDGSSFYNIKDSSLNYLYNNSESGSPTKFHQKIYGISFDEYIMDSSNNDSSNNNYYMDNNNLINNYSDHIVDSDTTLKLPNIQSMLNGQYTDLLTKRNDFKTKFEAVVSKFNDLNEDEMKILNDTGISIEKLNKAVRQYKELYYQKDISSRYRQMFDSQKQSTSKLYDRSQYIMALTGIASIVAAMFLFNSMK